MPMLFFTGQCTDIAFKGNYFNAYYFCWDKTNFIVVV